MKRIVSGVQATGNLHLGNYLGAMKHWAAWQADNECFFFIPDLHTLNVRPDPEQLRAEVLNNVAWLLAVGIDPAKATIYVQSQIPAHAELCWILNNYVTMGELSRMTQYKDKAAKRGAAGELVALFAYPVLMAADILLYDADLVPVGEDQQQHVELTRTIASRFNNLHGPIFKLPEPALPDVGGRIMNLQHPERKMSKSDAEQSGNVRLLDAADSLRQAVQRAVTDSGNQVSSGADKPALTNLLQIYAALAEITLKQVEEQFAGKGYGEFKQTLADLLVEKLTALQERYQQFRGNPGELEQVLAAGRERASGLAEAKLAAVKRQIGLI